MSNAVNFELPGSQLVSVIATANPGNRQRLKIDLVGADILRAETKEHPNGQNLVFFRRGFATTEEQPAIVTIQRSRDGETWEPSDVRIDQQSESEVIVVSENGADRDSSGCVVRFSW